MGPADVIRRAAQLIRDGGWIQGTMKDHHGRRCVLGALDDAAGGTAGIPHLARLVVNALQLSTLRRSQSFCPCHTCAAEYAADPIGPKVYCEAIVQWNDGSSQTAENVITGLEFAALIAERVDRVSPYDRTPVVRVIPPPVGDLANLQPHTA